jgi:hypothetical protein
MLVFKQLFKFLKVCCSIGLCHFPEIKQPLQTELHIFFKLELVLPSNIVFKYDYFFLLLSTIELYPSQTI